MFVRLGRFDVARRVWVLAGAVLVLVVSCWACSGLSGRLSYGGFMAPAAEATRAADAIRTEVGEGGADVLVTFRSKELAASRPAFREAVEDALRRAPKGTVDRATTAWSSANPLLFSLDRHATVVPILLKGDGETGRTQSYLALRDALRAPGFEVTWTGPSAIISEIVQRSQRDLVRTELMVLPLMMLLMVFVFRGVVAALLPVVTGVLATAAALAALRAVADVIEVPYVTVNLVVAIGLAAGVDAGLLIVSRFREELRAGRTPAEAVAITVDTAGRTVALSGVVMTFIAVGLAFFPLGFVRALGIGAAAGLLVGALVTVTVLPALLFCLGEHVDALSPAWLRRQGGRRDGVLWGRVARAVMQKPIAYTCAVSALLLALAVPFLHTVIGFPDQRMLPAGAPARVAAERMEHDFAVSGLGTLQAIATFDHPVDRGRGHADLLTWTRNVSELPGARGVLVAGTTGNKAVIYVGQDQRVESASAKSLVRAVRALPVPGGSGVLVGGASALAVDTMDTFYRLLPRVLAFMVITSFVLLTVALRSLVLPLKALVMNGLSIGASFGALTWIFQDGHASRLLGAEPTGYVDALAPIVMLFLLIAVSMDYELFLLLRIREQYRLLGDDRESVAVGIERSGRVISAAAAAVLVVTACFATSSVVMVKEICVGVFLAVLIDAVLVRAVLVPAVMRLLGAANWWWPRLSRSSGTAGKSRSGKGGRKWRTGKGGRPEAAPEHAARLPAPAEASAERQPR
ncbi:MMPL family transporter [Streptomyces sp. 6N106]|uniref:MMPL family transporter n=1 Tax=Streptomyces sp. 6N106 TaxID=3457418 RepID=UPI003FD39D6A